MTRFAFNLLVAYLAERFIVKPEPTSAEAILRWRLALTVHNAAQAFEPMSRYLDEVSGAFLRLAEEMRDDEGGV